MSISSFSPKRSAMPLPSPMMRDFEQPEQPASVALSRLAAQVILMGQQGFHLAVPEPDVDNLLADEVEDDDF
jgi:hypothetical protein